MDFMLTDEQRQIRDSIARICAEFGEDYWYHKDLNHEFPHEFSRAFADAGWFGAIFPEECGGSGLGLTEAAIIMSEVGRNGFNACSTLHMNMFNVRDGILIGAGCWLGFVLTTVTVNNAFAGRKPMLSVIDSIAWLGAMVIIGGIIGWFGP